MKKGLMIGAVLAVAVLAFVLISLNPGKTTGQATQTPGANYGPIEQNPGVYMSCSYIGENDGWEVTKKATIQYVDKTIGGNPVIVSDHCEGSSQIDDKVREYHCDGEVMQKRLVQCPNQQFCRDGICTSN